MKGQGDEVDKDEEYKQEDNTDPDLEGKTHEFIDVKSYQTNWPFSKIFYLFKCPEPDADC